MPGDISKQHLFDGAWLPSAPASLIGPQNFRVLRNLRYRDSSVQGVLGYSSLHETALDTYTDIRNGFQLRCPDGTEYVFVQAWDAAGTASRLFRMVDTAPDGAEFDVTPAHSDAAGGGVGRFCDAPGGQMVYCNGKESLIWGGTRGRCAAVFAATSEALASPKDYTDPINSTLDGASDVMALDAAGHGVFAVFTTRPIQGMRVTVKTANASASSLTVKYWDGTALAACSSVVDGTTSGGKALAQTGDITFATTVGLAKPRHFHGLYFYCYTVALSAGTATVSNITVDAPMQGLIDIWDGVFRTITQFQASRSSKWEDFTLEVNEESSVLYPIVALCGGLTSSDSIIVQCEDRLSGLRVKMNADKRNATASVLTVKYWNGTAWAAVSGLGDGTAVSGATLAQTGVVSWAPPADGLEFPQYLFGSTGFCYQLTFSGTLTAGTSNDGTSIDLVQGIPAQLVVPAYSFATDYKGRVLLCGRPDSKEGNRVDYSLPFAPDVYNGDMASGIGASSLYVGGSEPLTAACNVYNRFGSSVYETAVFFKNAEIHILDGEDPDSFKLYTISRNLGCPAPLTVATAEIGFEMSQGVTRNVVLFVSHSGPYMFDASAPAPLPGLEIYFDPSKSECVTWEAIEAARGWYDALYREYNLLLPIGGSTVCNLWVAYDLVRKKWFRKDPVATGAEMPQCAFPVVDGNGARHVYGGLDTGYLMRLEHGTNWNGKAIRQTVETGDFWPDNDAWSETRIRRVKVLAERIDEPHLLKVSHIADTGDFAVAISVNPEYGLKINEEYSYYVPLSGTIITLNLGPDDTLPTVVQATVEVDKLAKAHRFRFEVDTMDTTEGLRLVCWGYQYRAERTAR